MKAYRINTIPKIFIGIIFIITFALPIIVLLLWSDRVSLVHIIASIILIIMSSGGFIIFNNLKVIIDNEKIEIHNPLVRRDRILFWNEVGEATSSYFLFPETGGFILVPKVGIDKKKIYISMWGMHLELFKDILSHLPHDAKVYLYPYLKRKLEGKQTWFYIK